MSVSFFLPHPVAVSAFMIRRGLCACGEMVCVLYVSFGSKVRPRTYGCIAMGSALLFILGLDCSYFFHSSSLCHQTFRFHCSVHLYPISLNLRRPSKVQGCVKREHRNICAMFSASSPHVQVVLK